MKPCSIAASSAVLVLLSTTLCFGQALPYEIASFPMPPPSGYAAEKTFTFTTDFGYYTAPLVSLPGTTANASDYKYVRYSGLNAKKLVVYGAWGTTPIPPPQGGADACGHAHTSYGVWAKIEIRSKKTRALLRSGWVWRGGGGMSGVRNARGQCEFITNGPLAATDQRFGWGQRSISFNIQDECYMDQCYSFTDFVVGALSNTHGWGSCKVPSGEFKACHEPSYITGYTLPLP